MGVGLRIEAGEFAGEGPVRGLSAAAAAAAAAAVVGEGQFAVVLRGDRWKVTRRTLRNDLKQRGSSEEMDAACGQTFGLRART